MLGIRKIIGEADIIDLRATTKEEALRELVDVLAARPEVTDADDFLGAIFAREKIISTGIGIGLAMPHVKTPSVTDFVVAIGRSRAGIDFDSLDEKPVYIVAMIGASADQSSVRGLPLWKPATGRRSPPSGFTVQIWYWPPRSELKAMCEPFGLNRGPVSLSAPEVSCVTSRPSEVMSQMSPPASKTMRSSLASARRVVNSVSLDHALHAHRP